MSSSSTWSLRNIYLYLVCLITLIMVIFAVVNVVRSVVELAYPEPQPVPYLSVPKTPDDVVADPELQRQQQAEQEKYQQAWSRRRAVVSLVGAAAMLLVAGPLYAYHWRKIEHERASR